MNYNRNLRKKRELCLLLYMPPCVYPQGKTTETIQYKNLQLWLLPIIVYSTS